MKIAVLGAGHLGRDVAQVAADAGHAIRLHDGDANTVMDAIDDVERRMGDAVDAGDITRSDREEILEQIDATTGLEAAVADAEVVIETASLDASALQARFADLEEVVDRDAIVATTAEGVSITAAAAGLRHPDRAIGLRLSDPLQTPVIEVVVADQTVAETLERVESLVESLDRIAAVVADHPGVVSTRLALIAEVEAMRVLDDAIATVPDVDDAIALRHDLPMGPLERADRAGLDRRLTVLEYLAEQLGQRFAPPQVLYDLVEAGHTGADSGTGFYEWENGEPTTSALPDPEVVERIAGPDDPAR
jgi:3-hydroxybutyryl-CoA dehydrogenase